MKMEWKIHQDRDIEDEDIISYTITPDHNFAGWNTDSGYEGYGLPKDLAIWMCQVINESQKVCPFIFEFGCWKKRGSNEMD